LASTRHILGVIGGSILSVGGVAFSVVMVALTLTSGQYGPKILRNFLEDGVSKLTLGFFLGTYVYTMVALMGLAAVDRPRLTVAISLVLAFAALASFVHFIHRTATDLQADQIVNRLGEQLRHALRALAEDASAPDRSGDTTLWRRAARPHPAHRIASNGRGYVQAIDYAQLVRWAEQNSCLMQVRGRAGDFVVEGTYLFKVYGCDPERLEDVAQELNARVVLGPIRTPVQDPEYAITQINQLAARALSPGINDPGTAITCIDWCSLALSQIVDRDIPGCLFLDDKGHPRLLARVTDFAGVLKAVYAPLRQFVRSEVSVTIKLFESLCRLAELTGREQRLAAIALHGDLLWAETDSQSLNEYDLRDLRRRHRKLRALTRPEAVEKMFGGPG
jgi:uncharacterized membrane protein